MKRSLLLVITFFAIASLVQGQARDTVAMMRTRYNTAKNNAKPQGELKQKLDAIDQQLARASQLGRTGEMRRLYTEGIALVNKREWTAETEFNSSLVLRTERVFVSPENPVLFRLEQIYSPAIELTDPLSVQVFVNRPPTAGPNAQPGALLKEGGVFTNVSRDLLDEPFRFGIDLSGIPDGRSVVRAEVKSGSRVLGAAALSVEVRRGLDNRLSRLQASNNPDVLYPVDYIRNVDQGRIAIGQFDLEKELTQAEAGMAALQQGKDPFAGKTGDFKRHYLLQEAGEIMPYRVYVPASYKGDRPYPLIIALHGNGLTEDYFFTGAQGLQKLAEERGYIVAAPLGYRVDGGYGRNNGSRSAEELPKLERSEKDVMHVLDLMSANYKIDADRIFVAGHSMGGGGAWYLGARYPQIWAGLATFAGGGDPSTVSQMKQVPQFVVHGDADTTASVEQSRSMVDAIKRQGLDYQYIEVPGGTHGGVVAPNEKAMFDFFDKRSRVRSN
jgi:dienelactone hydrolase